MYETKLRVFAAVFPALALAPVLAVMYGCTPAQQQAPVQTALDGAQAVCQNQLLRSDTPKMLIDSGVLPALVPAIIESTCAGLPLAELLAGTEFRSTGVRALQKAARQRGLLP